MSDELASLGIEVDANGAIRQVNTLDASLAQLGRTSTAVATTTTTKVTPAFAAIDAAGGTARYSLQAFAGGASAAGIASVAATPGVEMLGAAIGAATGTLLITGAIMGIQALIEWMGHLGDAAKAAAEDQDRLAKALGTHFLPKTGPRSELNKEFNAALAERARLTKELMGLEQRQDNGEMFLGGKIAKVKNDLAAVQQAIEDAYAGSVTELDKVTVRVQKAKDHTKEWEASAARLHAYLERIGHLDLVGAMRAVTSNMEMPLPDVLGKSIVSQATAGKMPTVHVNDSLTREQIKTREQLGIDIRGSVSKNAEIVANAVVQSAGVIVNALNLGGGGKGSSIGGALGSVAGRALGEMAGSSIGSTFGSLIAPGIGTIIGGMAGSLLGGLFDHHKKAVDENTKAVQALTSEIRNAPSGYKVAYDRDRAAVARYMYDRVADESALRARRGNLRPSWMGA